MNKVLNAIIILLVIACLIVGGFVGLNYFKLDNQKYNDAVLELSLDTIKGNVLLSEIESYSEEGIKKGLIDFYNSFFFSETDLYKVCENINVYKQNKARIETVHREYINSNTRDSKDIYLYSREDLDFYKLYAYDNSSNDDSEPKNIQDLRKLYDFYYMYNGKDTDNNFEEKDGDLYIHTDKLVFENGYCLVHYDGLEFVIIRDLLEKKSADACKLDEDWQKLEITKEMPREGYIQYMVSNGESVLGIQAEKKFGKIVSIKIVY